NRERPLSDHNGTLKLADDGNLVVVDGENNTVWSTNVPPKLNNTVAVLLETGDLVLSSDSDRDTRFWESFNNPTDTFLPGMRVRVNPTSGENRAFTPWMSETDPSPGRYSLGIDPIGPPEIVIWEGETRKWRSGPWDSVIFTGIPDMSRVTNYIYGFKLSSPPERDGSVYFTYVPSDSSDLLRFQITLDGVIEQFRWNKDAKSWTLLLLKPSTECEKYNRCGNYSVCDESKEFGSGKCSCIDGFEPVNQNLWDDGDFSGGCKRRVPLNCSQSLREDEFMELRGMKLPDFGSFVSLRNSETCKDVCVRDCLCNAYAFVRGIGCMIWTRDLIDMERFQHGGQSINIRLAESELGGKENSKLWIIILSVIGAFLLVLCIWILCKFKKRVKAILWRNKHLPVFEENKDYSVKSSRSTSQVLVGGLVDTPDFPIFSFNSVALATGNFAEENKLGQGGFGTVYKGNFPGDTEIAVKRLSGKSKQGLEEFKNEILLIAKLQHRNLVRLVGCCIENNEKILLYEYMPNKSLDSFLFDEGKRGSLDWKKRWDIIGGIARGLLYLHRDSRLKIIHRDLKASNILLDKEMNPKISDFGMARIFNYRQDQANTIRVVGTYGYMAPEYAMEGMFSDKSDVYSFGVLILEIVSGSKNFSFRGSEHGSLIGYAWNLWSQGKTKELIDPTVKDTQDVNEAMRCVHVGMLCTQDSVIYRPNIGALMVGLCCLCIWILWNFRKRVKDFLRKNREYSVKPTSSMFQVLVGDQVDTPDLPTFSFNSVASATGDFSEENKLGQGGFGTVYKGTFSGGREIAVKRLSGKSKEGLEEFKNEILLIAKLQHRNLVRLLGCCIENDEKILLYEYMPNNSLDHFLFDESKQRNLEWRKRWDIIGGIARGLLYLHRDSRLKIIHRDLKASNILLDKEINPKISDFGMARIFNYRQDQANTIRVVGTYGYMAPEYAMEGRFSEKSDVYSFGVLIMEIVCGRKNISFRGSEHGSLIGYAWHLWSQGKTKELIDPTMMDNRDVSEAIRCIHVGMLCTQDSVIYRPNMGSVLLMLESQTSHLPRPRQPTFHSFLNFGEILEGQNVATVNDITLTTVVGR
ncbi:hypothetical protein F2Q70_00036465, partial [Brassica cretica]